MSRFRAWLAAIVLLAALAAPSAALGITGWTVKAYTPTWSSGELLFSGSACANLYCGGPAAWGDITVFAEQYVNGSWQAFAYLCDPFDCGTRKDNNFQAFLYVQACVHGVSYRTQTDASVLLTGGWQYKTVYSASQVLC